MLYSKILKKINIQEFKYYIITNIYNLGYGIKGWIADGYSVVFDQ